MKYEAILEMELTPYMENRLIEGFNLEIEAMQGTREELPDGRARIYLTITDPEKGELARRFILHCIANAEQPINKS